MWNVELLNAEKAVIGEVIGFEGTCLPKFDETAFPILRFVDPYGETTLNSYQARVMLSEWKQLEERAKLANETKSWKLILSLIEKCESSPLHFLRWIGD